MIIRLMPRVEDIENKYIEGSAVIVIDVLRATSVITTALDNGAERVVPVLTVEEAFSVRDRFKNSVLGGERKGLKIEGFDGGNSPLEYTKDFIGGKTLITTTSNGTRAIRGCIGAKEIIIGSMLNGSAAAKRAVSWGENISIVCAGTLGRFSLDDFLCAGYIIDEVLKIKEYEMDDLSFLSHHTFAENKNNIYEFMKNAAHSRYLMSIGLEEDVKYCCSTGTIEIVPVYEDGAIIAKDLR